MILDAFGYNGFVAEDFTDFSIYQFACARGIQSPKTAIKRCR
jgi:hypothetical protein